MTSKDVIDNETNQEQKPVAMVIWEHGSHTTHGQKQNSTETAAVLALDFAQSCNDCTARNNV